MQRTLEYSPELQIAAAEAQKFAGDWMQTRLYPNPEFGLNVNNTADDINVSFKNTVYEISQTVEWMPKRWSKQRAALYEYYAACTWHERVRLSVLNQFVRAFALAVAAQEALELAKLRKQIAESALSTVMDVSEAGKGSGIQTNKAKVELALAEVDLQKAQLEYFSTKEVLALSWGAACPDFDRLEFAFYEVQEPPSLELCCAKLDQHPEYRAAYYRYLAAQSQLRHQRAARIPDVTFTLGVETAERPDDRAVAFGLTVPIPVWDLNQGNIYRAKSEKVRLCELCNLRRSLLYNKQAIAHQEVVKAYREVQLLKDMALAVSETSFELAKEGYQRGKFQYLDMLDSQRTLFEVRDKYIQAVLKYHISKADLEYLVTQGEGS